MKQNTIVFFCVGTGGHVLPVINLIDDLHQRGIEKRKIEVVTDKRGSQYFKDRDIDVHSIDIYRSKTGMVGYLLNILKIIKSIRLIEKKIDLKALDCYFSMGYVPGEQCILQGYKKLPASSYLEFNLNNEKISAILNLTIPAAHYEISKKSLEAGKHVYSEKPLSINISQAKELLQISKEKNLLLGCAPDTFFGGRWQTVKKLINDNVIGRPTAIHAFVGTHGTERHHPNPDFYYKVGGGPMLDLGPYYLTMMVFLLGPISKVCGISNKSSNFFLPHASSGLHFIINGTFKYSAKAEFVTHALMRFARPLINE